MKSAIAILTGFALLGACSDGSEQSAAVETPQQAALDSAATEAEPAPEPPPLPNEFSRTAWRARDGSGALFTTFLDPGGRYRDMRNGDPWQQGVWEYDAQDRICFTPDAEDSLDQCWRPERMDEGGHMIVTSGSGRRVQLESVEYRRPEPPVESETDGEDGEETADGAAETS
ncbi:hypothetical protein [Erythrobacter sp. QSSC1-22B]|uniref:hypothetical protein n=1 Tax=Erythrobacter sp. QSSC1-22B TaxID=1860125 RepID=UPI00119FD9F1|nr:hypothetical protein [Erythrobacter sp. QSSC1-22B]